MAWNTVYQLLTCEYIMLQKNVPNPPLDEGASFGEYYNFIQNYSGIIATTKFLPILTDAYEKRSKIGVVNLLKLRDMVDLAKKGSNKDVKNIEHAYICYTGAIELIYAYIALELMGLKYIQIMRELCDVIVGGNPNEFDQALTIFGTNINMCYKPMQPHWV